MNASNTTNGTEGCIGTTCPGALGYHDLSDLESTWLLLCTFLVVSMQLGFAMLEVGSVREAHRMTVLAKNVMDSCISCLVFGLACEFWQPSFIHSNIKANHDKKLFQWSFCATSVTICSGSMAERAHILGYLSHVVLVSSVIFVPIAEAVWGNSESLLRSGFHGRFGNHSYHDCAGSGVVHLLGGITALAGNVFLGRRIMMSEHQSRWQDPVTDLHPGKATGPAPQICGAEDGMESPDERDDAMSGQRAQGQKDFMMKNCWQRRFEDTDRDRREFQANAYLQVMGAFILWVGWYGFNAGGVVNSRYGSSSTAGLVSWNTTLAAAAGGLGSYLYLYGFRMNLDCGFLCNGVLSGLVSITACCDIATPNVAAAIGLIGGLVIYPGCSQLLIYCNIDDPVDAVPVHVACGLFGVVVVAFCVPDCQSLQQSGYLSDAQDSFCREGHDVRTQLLAQLFGAFLLIVWTLAFSASFWLLLVVCERTRAREVDEIQKVLNLLQTVPMSDEETHLLEQKLKNTLMTQQVSSPTLRKLLRAYGWTGNTFKGKEPSDLAMLIVDLENASRNFETALEANESWVVRRLTDLCRTLRLPELPFWHFRLRIHPQKELSGLGASGTDGGKLYAVFQKAARQLAEMHQDATKTKSLQHEVDELGMLVRSQDVLIRRLMSRRPSSSSTSANSNRLQRVPEERQKSLHDASLSRAGSLPGEPAPPVPDIESMPLPKSCQSGTGGLSTQTTARSTGSAWQEGGASSSTSLPAQFRVDLLSETASTVSDASMGCLSPGSMANSTPPLYGHRPQFEPTNQVAEELVNMMRMQQQVLMSLQTQLHTGPQPMQPMQSFVMQPAHTLRQIQDSAFVPAQQPVFQPPAMDFQQMQLHQMQFQQFQPQPGMQPMPMPSQPTLQELVAALQQVADQQGGSLSASRVSSKSIGDV